jgi:hypothetical protein
MEVAMNAKFVARSAIALAALTAGPGACRTYFHECVAKPRSDGCEARGEADIGNIGEPSNDADALLGRNPKGRGEFVTER